jgi:hypothetical protein
VRTLFSVELVASAFRDLPLVVVDAGTAGGPATYWRETSGPSLTRSRKLGRISAVLSALAQNSADPAWGEEIGPGRIRLRMSRWLFAAARLMPSAWSRCCEADFELRYQHDGEQRGILYDSVYPAH